MRSNRNCNERLYLDSSLDVRLVLKIVVKYHGVEIQMTTKEQKEKIALELMREYGVIKAQLNDYGISRTEREPTGEYAEWLVASKLGFRQAENTVQSGYDLIDPQTGKTYQIKARRIFKDHSYKVSISKYKKYPFDYLILILFNEDFTVRRAYQYTYESIPLFFKSKGANMELMISLSNYREKLENIEDMRILAL